MTVGSTNYSIDLTGVTAQNSAITTAIVSALQTASVGTSVSTFSVQDSTDTISPQREFKNFVGWNIISNPIYKTR